MLLKDITELAVATSHTEESIEFLDCKVQEHRHLLLKTFPEFKLRPKHHFLENYAQLIKAFGPLSDVWTMRFEGKHKFFKRVIRNAQNYKNVALTLTVKHQLMMSYCLESSSFFRHSVEMDKVFTAPMAEPHQQKITLRVILTESDIRKVILPIKPSTVEDLISILKSTLDFQCNFVLQYADPDFNDQLCNLTDIQQLQEKATLKIIPVLELLPVQTSEDQTDTLSSVDVSSVDSEILFSPIQERQQEWPEFFDIPLFSVYIEQILRQADLLTLRDGTYLNVSKEILKHEILEKIAESVYSFTPYPTDVQFTQVAQALITKHPCLQERGSASRCSGWKNSLKYKMANYRSKRRKSGCQNVVINTGKRGKRAGELPANKSIKKARKGELNCLPNFPEGFQAETLEDARKIVLEEIKKKDPNRVFLEFNRIVGRDLRQEFFGNLDHHSPRLIEIFRGKTGNVGRQLSLILKQYKTSEPTQTRTSVLRGLPILLGDKPDDFFRQAITKLCLKFSSGKFTGQLHTVTLLSVNQLLVPLATDSEQSRIQKSKVFED
ncbi:hypothetical protein WMY93_026136 [Mugilogobius chulae]|uniref:PB1 domain-containing protein n=1 Tax=Mugilogobius chulae TaxID=88201 RepID=A0AAW0N0W7_9GOBI